MSSSAAAGVSRGWAVHRSLTLLRVFLLASAVILVSGAILLGSLLTTALRSQALDDASASLTQYVDGVLRPELVRRDRIHVSPHLPLQIKQQLRRQHDIVSVKVWRPDGLLVWTNRAPQRIGQVLARRRARGDDRGQQDARVDQQARPGRERGRAPGRRPPTCLRGLR